MSESTDRVITPGFSLTALAFSVFSLLSLVACLVKGIVPIYFLEAVLWGGLVLYSLKKPSLNERASFVVVLLAVVVAAAQGYSIGRDAGSKGAFDSGRKAGYQTGYDLGESIGNASGYANCLACVSGVERACSKNPK